MMLWSSWVALGSVLFVLGTEMIVHLTRPTFKPLQCNAHARARWQAFFAICHMSGMAVALSGTFMPSFWCEIWSFWIAIFVGLQGWFLLAFGRMIHLVYDGRTKGIYWYAAFIVSSIVLVVPNDVFGYDFDNPFCIPSDRGRISLSVWLFVWSLILFTSLIKLCTVAVPSIEYDHIAWSCLWGFMFMVPIAAASLAFEDDELFFKIHVTNISVFHFIMSFRTRWPAIWFARLASKGVRKRYLAHFEETRDAKHMDYKTVFEAQDDRYVMMPYMAFVASKDPDLAQLFNKINEVRALAEKGSPLFPTAFHDGIYRAYFSNISTAKIPEQIQCAPETSIHELRESVLRYIHKHYDSKYFGSMGKIRRFLWPCANRTNFAARGTGSSIHDLDHELGSSLDEYSTSSDTEFNNFGRFERRATPLDSSSSGASSVELVYTGFDSFRSPQEEEG